MAKFTLAFAGLSWTIRPLPMNSKYLEQAQQLVGNPELLVNLVSRRVRQLAQGHRPMVQAGPHMDFADIALKEIVEGKLSFEQTAPDTGDVPPAE